MASRRSIHIEGLSHLTAIPVATRIGPLLTSSVIAPFDPGTRNAPATYAAQAANMLAAAGADWRHVAKMEFWVPAADARAALEAPWTEKFPDAQARPSRHTHIGEGNVITASFIAYIEG
jgi:2-iminobutanoate/2-iminopropanoate deaminase